MNDVQGQLKELAALQNMFQQQPEESNQDKDNEEEEIDCLDLLMQARELNSDLQPRHVMQAWK